MNFLNYKDYRQYLVLNLIQHFGPISRTRLADITGYRPATIGEIIGELLGEHLVIEKGSPHVRQGRRRMMLELNAPYICAIGITITSDLVVFVISTISGEILRTEERTIRDYATSNQLIMCITETVKELIVSSAGYKILGIGICDSAQSPNTWGNRSNLSETFTHFSDWTSYDLRNILQETVSLPVQISTRNILIAVTEEKFGEAQGMKDFICLDLCDGVGMSFFCNGSSVGGATGVSGEIGHTVAGENRNICYCGKPGCVERAAAFPAIREEILRALDSGVASVLHDSYDRGHVLSVQDVRGALDAGDALCHHCVKQAARHMGVAVANAVAILNPECVIFRGYMMELGDFFIDALTESIRENTLPILRNVPLIQSSLLDSILPLGSAAMIFNDFLKSDEYKWIHDLVIESEM